MAKGASGWRGIGVAVVLVTAAGVGASVPDGAGLAADSRCLACHRIQAGLSHPTGVVPSSALPAGLALVNGRIGCITCHEPSADPPGRFPHGTMRLAARCDDCHRPSSASRPHTLATAFAHHGSGAGGSPGDGPGLDGESVRCLGCHDGATASARGVRVGRSAPGMDLLTRMTSQHPIAVRQGPRFKDDTLRKPDDLDPRVRLYDGQVGCGSCHSAYAPGPSMLVMPNERSRLCLACHEF